LLEAASTSTLGLSLLSGTAKTTGIREPGAGKIAKAVASFMQRGCGGLKIACGEDNSFVSVTRWGVEYCDSPDRCESPRSRIAQPLYIYIRESLTRLYATQLDGVSLTDTYEVSGFL